MLAYCSIKPLAVNSSRRLHRIASGQREGLALNDLTNRYYYFTIIIIIIIIIIIKKWIFIQFRVDIHLLFEFPEILAANSDFLALIQSALIKPL